MGDDIQNIVAMGVELAKLAGELEAVKNERDFLRDLLKNELKKAAEAHLDPLGH